MERLSNKTEKGKNVVEQHLADFVRRCSPLILLFKKYSVCPLEQ